jgi:uncharacterized membrane protein
MEAVLRVGSGVSLVLLVAGLLLWLREPLGERTELVLNTGLVLLMVTPVSRLLSAVTEEIRARDWRFAALGFAVLALLGCSVMISFL